MNQWSICFLLVPPTALAASVSRSGIARARMTYNLTCTVSKTVDGLINSPAATWTTRGEEVTNGDGIAVSTMTNDITSISTLTFDPLRTSHNGIYSCVGTLTSPALFIPLMPSTVEILNVQSEIYWKSVFTCLTTLYGTCIFSSFYSWYIAIEA